MKPVWLHPSALFCGGLFIPIACLLWLPDAVATPPAAQSGTATGDTAYIDQLIGLPDTAMPDTGVAAEAMEQPEGFRTYITEYRHYQEDRDSSGRSYEDGLVFNARRETRHYGELEMLASARSNRPSDESGDGNSTGGRLTLRQYGFAASPNWLMDNSAGVLRSDADPVVSSSYRFNLPSTLVSGLRNWSRAGRSAVRLSAGKIGTLGTGRIEDFDTTSGKLASLGLSHGLDERWTVAGQVIGAVDLDDIDDHESAALALQYRTQDQRHRYVGHVLAGTEGGNAVWLDGDDRIGRWRHRYGLFRFEPDLLWSDATLTDDQQGLYTRSELRSPRYNLTAGTDFSEDNVKDRDNRPQSRTSNVFITGNRRLRRLTGVGGTVSLNYVDPRNDLAGEDAHLLRLSSYLQHRFPLGSSRFEVFIADVEDDGDEGELYGAIWDQGWELSRLLSLSTTLEHQSSRDVGDEDSRNSASVLLRHDLTPLFNWHGNASYTRISNRRSSDTDNYNLSLGAAWRFLPQWDARLDLTWTKAEEDDAIFGNDFDEDEKTLLLSIRHTRKSGRPMLAVGRKTGKSGFGEVSGEVFYDANRDGRRQAGERAASGVFVYLDRRYERVTDSEGRFRFTPVPAGEHSLSLAIEDLPLPWGLDDETPRPITVYVRGEAVMVFGLTRIDE